MLPQRVSFAVCYVAYLSIYFVRKPLAVTKRSMGAALGLDESALGLFDTAFLLSYTAGQFFSGPVAKARLSNRWVLFVLFSVAGVASVAFGMINTYWFLAIVWAINGFAQGGVFPVCIKEISEATPPAARGTVLGLFSTSQQIGGILSTAMAGFLVTRVVWGSVFVFSGAVALCAAGIILLFLPSKNPTRAATSVGKSATAERGLSFWQILVPTLPLSASYFFVKLVRYTLMFWLPFFFIQSARLQR